MDINALSYEIIGAAIEVHQTLGPGLLESVYQKALALELDDQGYGIKCEVPIKVIYKDQDLGQEFRLDILVEDQIIIELKSVERIMPVHKKQLLTYLKLTEKKLGLLINFNEPILKDGITRIANNL